MSLRAGCNLTGCGFIWLIAKAASLCLMLLASHGTSIIIPAPKFGAPHVTSNQLIFTYPDARKPQLISIHRETGRELWKTSVTNADVQLWPTSQKLLVSIENGIFELSTSAGRLDHRLNLGFPVERVVEISPDLLLVKRHWHGGLTNVLLGVRATDWRGHGRERMFTNSLILIASVSSLNSVSPICAREAMIHPSIYGRRRTCGSRFSKRRMGASFGERLRARHLPRKLLSSLIRTFYSARLVGWLAYQRGMELYFIVFTLVRETGKRRFGAREQACLRISRPTSWRPSICRGSRTKSFCDTRNRLWTSTIIARLMAISTSCAGRFLALWDLMRAQEKSCGLRTGRKN